MKFRPSSMPALAVSPGFVSGPGGDDADTGTLRHAALAALFRDQDPVPLSKLDTVDREGVEWAEEQIRLLAPLNDYSLVFETRDKFTAPDFSTVIEGTPDCVCGPVVFDLKWRDRNYIEQMACYALMTLKKGWDKVTVHILYAATRRKVTMTFTQEEAEDYVQTVIDHVAAHPKPEDCTPSEYCGWCARALTCPVLISRSNAVVEGRPDWALEQYHSSKIESAEEMAKALTLARAVAAWCESVEHHAKEMVIKQGKMLPGFKLQYRQGKRVITSTVDAFPLVGIPQDQYLALCEVPFSKLAESLRQLHSMSKDNAERDLERRLGGLIQRQPATASLVIDKTQTQKPDA